MQTLTKLRRIRASKKQSVIDDLDLENTVSSITSRRIKERSDKLLDSVGINEHNARKFFEEDGAVKKRSLRVTYDESVDNKDLTKWTALTPMKESMVSFKESSLRESRDEDSSAALRARMSRARLEELEEESNAIAERQAARERRAAKLRAILAESAEENDTVAQSMRMSARKEKRSIEY